MPTFSPASSTIWKVELQLATPTDSSPADTSNHISEEIHIQQYKKPQLIRCEHQMQQLGTYCSSFLIGAGQLPDAMAVSDGTYGKWRPDIPLCVRFGLMCHVNLRCPLALLAWL